MERDSIRYWSPAFIGAAVACLVLLAALQLASRSNPMSPQAVTAQRKLEHGFQASRTSFSETAEGSDSSELRREGDPSSEGPLLLVRPKPTTSAIEQ